MYRYKKRLWTCEICGKKVEFLSLKDGKHVCGECSNKSTEADNWTGKEDLTFLELSEEDQEELYYHAFDWCVSVSGDMKVGNILSNIGKAINKFKEHKKLVLN